eukprot:CAMPEP_0174710172 /NCGR_PEP_ID=MMETSP1094-20130205/11883_1 /TAXON_ID=156173 /ORGANISM="Chrysochromulina brevifilum, Strain UTEX LB 985" /LENGTH=227 /DNA_ID=CAMNT_0015908939 /DNA_START=11 /DNA_END=694 /DNA_ORIENTATION=+
MGFYSKASAEEVEAAKEEGRRKFEAAGADSAFKSVEPIEQMRFRPSRELIESLCDDFGRMDPKKMRKFASMLEPSDPRRAQIEADLDGMDGDADDAPLQPAMDLQRQPAAREGRNEGEAEGGADGKTWRWEQTNNGDESEILVRFRLQKPATKKEVKVGFKVQSLKVTVAGEDLFDSKLHGKLYPDECTWSLAEHTASERYSSEIVHELQVLLSLADGAKWTDLCAK